MSYASGFKEDVRLYLENISRVPLLSPEEERRLGNKWRNDRDVEARKKLVSHNLRLVVSIARKYRKKGLDFMELISEGNEGLFLACEDYDPAKGRFTTYATWWIRQSMSRAIARNSRYAFLVKNEASLNGANNSDKNGSFLERVCFCEPPESNGDSTIVLRNAINDVLKRSRYSPRLKEMLGLLLGLSDVRGPLLQKEVARIFGLTRQASQGALSRFRKDIEKDAEIRKIYEK